MTRTVAGIDLGGTAIKVALGDGEGRLLAQRSVPTLSHEGADAVLARMAAAVQTLQAEVGVERLDGVGVGVPGLADLARGVTLLLPNMPERWTDVEVSATLSRALDAPCRLINDARAAALGELRYGHGRGRDGLTMVFIGVGTGIGGGIVVDGRLRLGPAGAAGEVGHTVVDPAGLRCGCGGRGCLETVSAGPAITAAAVRLLRSGQSPLLHERTGGSCDRITPQLLAGLAPHDPLVRELLETACRPIGVVAANLVALLHPELIVLGGGVAEMGRLMLDTVRREIDERVHILPAGNVEVLASQLGPQAGVRGAVAWALEPPA